jgi:serine/threonine-protein kinase
MDDQRWKRLSRIFHEASARPADERDAFVRAECSDDPELVDEVRGLLAAEGEALDSLADDAVATAATSVSWDGRRVGPYRIVRETGSGGMGRVFLAERADGEFDQVVALKVVRSFLASDLLFERFRQERQILARLQHPNIAGLLDGGVTEDGDPYFALEYVEGEPIDAYCDRERLSVDERLRLFQDVCRALVYAHANLVVHRDLKPDNILATADGQVRLLDFGIAKVLAEDGDAPAKGTALLAMTPAYASPEQVRGEPVGTATDVYSLGVILYELLTGELPYDVSGRSPTEVERVVTDTEPERPSTRVGHATRTGRDAAREIEEARSTDVARLRKRLSGDLDVICLKALRKEPENRYGSVEALLDDVTRHIEGLPVLARPATLGYRLGKGIRRNRWAVGAAATVLLTSSTLVTFYTARLQDERDRAQVEAARAGAVADFLQSLFEVSDPTESLGETVTARELLDEGAARVDEGLADQPEVQATMLRVIGEVYASLGLSDRARSLLGRALALAAEVHGDTHEEVAYTRLALAQATQDDGDLVGAGPMFREAIATFRRVYGPDDPAVSEAVEQFAFWLESDGQYDEAEDEYRGALARLRQVVSPDDERIVSIVSNLGNLLRQMDRLDEAEPLLREALAGETAIHGERHPTPLSTARTLAALLRDQGRYAESDSLYRHVLEVRREVLGPRHPEVANTLNSYAILLDRMGEKERSLELSREFLSILEEIYREPHPSVAAAHSNLAISLHEGGALEEAAEHFQRSMEVQDVVLRPGHPNRAFPRVGLASVLREQGRPVEAEALLREALALRRGELGPEHRYVGESLSDLAAALLDQNRPAEAEPLLLEAYSILMAGEGPDANRTRTAARRLTALYEQAGREAEAAKYREVGGGSASD